MDIAIVTPFIVGTCFGVLLSILILVIAKSE